MNSLSEQSRVSKSNEANNASSANAVTAFDQIFESLQAQAPVPPVQVPPPIDGKTGIATASDKKTASETGGPLSDTQKISPGKNTASGNKATSSQLTQPNAQLPSASINSQISHP